MVDDTFNHFKSVMFDLPPSLPFVHPVRDPPDTSIVGDREGCHAGGVSDIGVVGAGGGRMGPDWVRVLGGRKSLKGYAQGPCHPPHPLPIIPS